MSGLYCYMKAKLCICIMHTLFCKATSIPVPIMSFGESLRALAWRVARTRRYREGCVTPETEYQDSTMLTSINPCFMLKVRHQTLSMPSISVG